MKLAILGYDELGNDIAHHFEKKGYHITFVIYKHKNISLAESQFQKVIYLPQTPEQEIEQIVTENDAFILTHSLSFEDRAQLKKIAHSFLQSAKAHTKKTLIFLSSVLIYGDHKGHWVDETSPLKAEKHHHTLLNEIESFFLSLESFDWKCCILRLASVYDGIEDLKKRLEKMQNTSLPGNGLHHTNMIHLEDVYATIEYVLRHHLIGIYNLCDNEHPTQKEFYESLAKKNHIQLPSWKGQEPAEFDFRASNHKLKAQGYILQYPTRE